MKYLFMGRESRMERAEKMALLDRGLTRAAEAIGDVTPAVMALYYARYPEAAASFEHHGLGKTAALEGEMVENCLYCLMHRSEEHTSELQSLMRISYAVFCLKKKKKTRKLR